MTEKSATAMIGDSGSALIARIRFAALQPTMCWIAPLMPQAMYRSGAMRSPVWPIWSEWGRQPRLVTTLDAGDKVGWLELGFEGGHGWRGSTGLHDLRGDRVRRNREQADRAVEGR